MALEISEKYKSVIERGDFQSLLATSPWPHYILDDFLPAETFKRVQERIVAKEKIYETDESHPAKIQLCHMDDIPLAELFFSQTVKTLFEGIAQTALAPNLELAIQFRQMTPESPAFPPHIDLIEAPSLVALYYISPGWNKKKGGEILLLEKEDSDFYDHKTKWIEPRENRLLLFMTRSNGWHTVRRVRDWTRTLVLTEWLIKD